MPGRLQVIRLLRTFLTNGAKYRHYLKGLNTGVLLLELDRIRNSEQYAYYLGWGGTAELADTYNFELGHIGDQDWLTLFGAAAPDLVYPLSCLFNRQLSTEYDEGIWMDIFKYFHECERLPENFVDGKPVIWITIEIE